VIFSVWRRIRDRKAWKSSRRREKLYRVYAGTGKNYRAIYQILDEVLIVLVVKVGDRKDVYPRVR
jgi:mRNA-degrading endonuclease RelE of RelBE toxin-antitoxin system